MVETRWGWGGAAARWDFELKKKKKIWVLLQGARKKHTYVCPAFEATGICAEASTCKLHHPKKKTEKKHTSEQKIVRGRYFDGGLIGVPDCEMATSEKLSVKGKEDIVLQEGKYPDYISLDVSDDEVETEPIFPCSSVF
ncbi:hypothetical protein RD792_000798 [Penstemon davidsonii]|uniref:C3H1-type domain-containing protein n=1 Tax=Penstemon davidsonii TaxID=160366 RepID=A0ABR0DLP6_9LAMI|nr:hypothetical protein RD792_000798 [Penstemon davidsonii]